MEIKLDRAAPVIFKPCVTSTNTVLKGLAAGGLADGFTLAALRQTSGRGRLGRSFTSPEGGLYMSMLLYTGTDLARTATLTPCAAVAVCRAISRVCGITPDIKWPNDLQLGGKKLCGILTESGSLGGRYYAIIGLGINVNTDCALFPKEVRNIAVSLSEVLGAPVDIEALLVAVVEELDQMFSAWKADTQCCLSDYRRLCISTNRPVTLIRGDERRAANSLGIDENYALIVNVNGAEEHITMGEVTLRNA